MSIEIQRDRIFALPKRSSLRGSVPMLAYADILQAIMTEDDEQDEFFLPDGQRKIANTETEKFSVVSAWREWQATEELRRASLTPALTFRDLRQANLARREAWRTERDLGAWTLPQWGNALCGELGEACNLIKKIDRGDFTLEAGREALGEELCDILTYLDLLADCAGIDLEEVTLRKWNAVSERVKSPVRLVPNFKEPS